MNKEFPWKKKCNFEQRSDNIPRWMWGISPVFHTLFHTYNIQIYTAMSGSKMLNLRSVQVED